MFKVSMMRFFALVFVVFCIATHVSAKILGKLQGPGSKRIVLDKDTIDYQLDYTQTYAFYNTTDKDRKQYYTLSIGGCKLEFRAGYCGATEFNNRHHEIKPDWETYHDYWAGFHGDFSFGTVNLSSISFHNYIWGIRNDQDYPCTPQFDSNSVPGKHFIDVSLSGEVAPGLVVNFGEKLLTTTMTSTSTLTSTLTSTPTSIPTSKKQVTWRIVFIIFIFTTPLAICVCVVVFYCYKNIYKSKYPIAEGTLDTVKTAQKPLIKETSLYGPNVINNRNTTQTELDTKSQATISIQTPK